MKVRCVDAKGREDVLIEGGIYEGELKFIDSLGEKRWQIKECNGESFYESRFKEVKELTFREVIADIKQGEVYENKNTTIHLNNEGVFIMEEKSHFNNTDMNILTASMIAINLDSKYQLQRKKYTFEEAFKALEEGKEIESLETNERLKLKDGRLVYFDSYDGQFNHADGIEYNEIKGKWYIND